MYLQSLYARPVLPVTAHFDAPFGNRAVERRTATLGSHGQLTWGARTKASPLPDEWVLRELMDSPLDSDASVLRLLERRGVITDTYFDPAYVPPADAARLGSSRPGIVRGLGPSGRRGATIDDVRWWLKTLRVLARMWQLGALDEPITSCWSDEGFVGLTSAASSWAQFSRALNLGVEAFQPRVTLGARNAKGSVNLFAAGCGQLFDLIASGVVPRRCSNANCSTIFVHQVGGSQAGRSRTVGVRFCSPSCARAETQRQYRRRQRSLGTPALVAAGHR